MSSQQTSSPERALSIAAGVVIIGLTAAAFWLSYAHLAEVARTNGLGEAPIRAWAWPATLDLFIVAGELMMLRAALIGRADGWAIGLTVAGSGGSIALNVAGVGAQAAPLHYVVAAVPPTAALLAFGALMRQVHQALSERVAEDTPAPVAEQPATPAVVAADTPAQVTLTRVAPNVPEIEAAPVNPLVICGDQRAWTLVAPPVLTRDMVSDEPADRLPTEAARVVLESAWAQGTSPTEAARLATRSTTYVKRVFARLDETRGPQPMPGQMPLDTTGAVA